MARSAKKRPASEPNESDVEDDEPAEAQSQPDKRKKRKSAQPAANVAEDSDERQQEVEEPSPDLSSSQRPSRKSKVAALEKRIWTADAPKRKILQSQAPDNPGASESRKPEAEERAQHPKPKRLAAAKYRAPNTEAEADVEDAASAGDDRHTEGSRTTKTHPASPIGSDRSQHGNMSTSKSTTSSSRSSGKSHPESHKALFEQVRQGDDDSPEASDDGSRASHREEEREGFEDFEGHEKEEDGEVSESTSESDLGQKGARTTERRFTQEVPQWDSSENEDNLRDQLGTPASRRSGARTARSFYLHSTAAFSANDSPALPLITLTLPPPPPHCRRRANNEEPPASSSPSPLRNEQQDKAKTSSKHAASRRTPHREELERESSESDRGRRRARSSDHKVRPKNKKQVRSESSESDHGHHHSTPPRQTVKTEPGSAKHVSRQGSRDPRKQDRHARAPEHSDRGTKRSRVRDETTPRWSDDDVPAKQPKVNKSSGAHTKKYAKKHSGKNITQAIDDHGTQSETGSEDERIDIVYKKGSKLGITEQRPRVKKTLNAAIFKCQADILLRNAFPDGAEKYNTIARSALVKCAEELGYTALAKRLKNDNDYALTLAAIPVDRIPLFRSQVRDAVLGAIQSTYHLRPGDVGHVNWLHKGCRYIYPHDYKKDKHCGDEPFALPIFTDGLRATYFKTPKSFGWKIINQFASSYPEKPDEKELPAAMVALASTAVFAAIDHHQTSPCEISNFSTNSFGGAYKRNIAILSSLKERSLEAYHDVMHELFKAVCGGTAGTSVHSLDDHDDLVFLQIPAKRRGA
ncbi:hypothetical protein ONZ51_g1124 [Trametes cubensis]|uniref:DUF6532 domain-containing protein n=1 Tax=Trametes cubensis TaxID=1111947 RepID=A0AAD7U223_9APHY|nr:hypothetical protein ONZ51_g1124 [Trametes cubensis]